MIKYEDLGLLNQAFVENIQKTFNEVLESGSYILGEQVEKFQKEFSTFCNSTFCIGVGNGTDALTLALLSFSFRDGAEVIVQANTYIASVLSIINSRLVPVLVEPDRSTYNLDPSLIEQAITPNTVAIMPVHLYGKACVMDEIMLLKEKYNLRVIEDCSQAHGARFRGKSVGTFGDFGAFSFYPTKNLGALGDGGCLLTNQSDLMKKAMLLRNYGSAEKDFNEIPGYNSRLDELQAGFLRVKLQSLSRMNEQRRRFASLYNHGLDEQFIRPAVHPEHYDVYHIYNVRHNQRDKLRGYLMKHNIETMIHYPVPPHKQRALLGILREAPYPVTEEIHATTLSLPISPIHTEDEILKVIETMNNF